MDTSVERLFAGTRDDVTDLTDSSHVQATFAQDLEPNGSFQSHWAQPLWASAFSSGLLGEM
jgi:hypothetical protein